MTDITVNTVRKARNENENLYEGEFTVDKQTYTFTFDNATKEFCYIDGGDDLKSNISGTELKQLPKQIQSMIDLQNNRQKVYAPVTIKEERDNDRLDSKIISEGSKVLTNKLHQEYDNHYAITVAYNQNRDAFKNKIVSSAMAIIGSHTDEIKNLFKDDVEMENATKDKYIEKFIKKVAEEIFNKIYGSLLNDTYKKFEFPYLKGMYEVLANHDTVSVFYSPEKGDKSEEKQEVVFPCKQFGYDIEKAIKFVKKDLDQKNLDAQIDAEGLGITKIGLNKSNVAVFQGEYKDIILVGKKSDIQELEDIIDDTDKVGCILKNERISKSDFFKNHFDAYYEAQTKPELSPIKYQYFGLDAISKEAAMHLGDIIGEANSHFIKDNYDLYKKEDFIDAVNKGFDTDELLNTYMSSMELLDAEKFADEVKAIETEDGRKVVALDDRDVTVYLNGKEENTTSYSSPEKAQEVFDMYDDALDEEKEAPDEDER